MLIVDRYLLRQFVRSFVVCFLSLAGLYVVFDAFTHLDEFLRCSERAGGLMKLMGTHYAFQSLLFFDRTAGLLTLVAAMFTVSWTQRHNEMTALMSAGISRIRVVKPIIIAAAVISVSAAASRELVMPRCREQLSRRPQDLVGDVGQNFDPQYDHRTDVVIRGKATFADQQRIEKPNFLLPLALSEYGRHLVAQNAYYRAPEGDRPGGYLLTQVEQPKDLAQRPSLRLGSDAVVITPRDAPDWLQPDQCFLASDVTFEQLTGGRAFRQFSSTPQLIASLRNASIGFDADIRVAIHTRIINPLLDMTLFFLGFPLVVSRESRNVFVAIGMCAGVVTVFLLVVIAFQQLGAVSLLSPALASWAPLMIFVPPAVGLAETMWQ
jgi:lipopolysaccharide export system permease protein